MQNVSKTLHSEDLHQSIRPEKVGIEAFKENKELFTKGNVFMKLLNLSSDCLCDKFFNSENQTNGGRKIISVLCNVVAAHDEIYKNIMN